MNFERFTDRAMVFLRSAQELARRECHQRLSPEHLLKALLDDPERFVAVLIQRAGGRSHDALAETEQSIRTAPRVTGSGAGQVFLAPALAKVFDQAEKVGESSVTVECLLLALAMEKEAATSRILAESGVTVAALNAAINEFSKGGTACSASTERVYDALTHFTRDLTEEASKGELDPIIGRDEEIRRALQILSRETNNNSLLVGEAGVGKTALIYGMAQRIAFGEVPESLRGKRVLALDLALIAGTKFRGEAEDRLLDFFSAISASEGHFILALDPINGLLNGRDAIADCSSVIETNILHEKIQIIATTTPHEYRRFLCQSFAGQFEHSFVSEPTPDETISILRSLKEKYELHHGVRIADSALVSAIQLSQEERYFSRQFLPSNAMHLIDEAASHVRLRVDSFQKMKEALDFSRIELERAQRRGDLTLAGELARRVIPDLERKLNDTSEREAQRRFNEEGLTPDQVVAVVSRWANALDRLVAPQE
jgi:ATP-dependent Clp protease ATP-binding subunit ClpB